MTSILNALRILVSSEAKMFVSYDTFLHAVQYILFQQIAGCTNGFRKQSIKCAAGSVKEPLEEMIGQPGVSMGSVFENFL